MHISTFQYTKKYITDKNGLFLFHWFNQSLLLFLFCFGHFFAHSISIVLVCKFLNNFIKESSVTHGFDGKIVRNRQWRTNMECPNTNKITMNSIHLIEANAFAILIQHPVDIVISIWFPLKVNRQQCIHMSRHLQCVHRASQCIYILFFVLRWTLTKQFDINLSISSLYWHSLIIEIL